MTVEELERTSLEGRFELIDGELVEMTPSGGDASATANTVAFHLTGHVRPRRLGRVYSADGGFVVVPGKEIVRVPDVAFVQTARIPADREHAGFLHLAPDLVVEVVSPFDQPAEVVAKALMWLDAGVRLVWVVDPRSRTVTVDGPDRNGRELKESDELDGGEVLPEFRVAVADLFA